MDPRTTTLSPVSAPSRFCGPPGVANGGWLCGQLASHVVPHGADFLTPAVEVTLRAPAHVDCALAIDRAQATQAETTYVGWWDHPVVSCFVCGLRDPTDGLRLFADRWTVPPADLPPTQLLWAALDCPTGRAHHRPSGVALLARLTARIHRPATPGEQLVVVARAESRQGRRRQSRCGIYDDASRLVATSHAIWLEPSREHEGAS